MPRVHILYEHSGDLRPHGCSYIRLLCPLTHPKLADDFKVTRGLSYEPADVLIVDRLWKPDASLKAVEELCGKVREDGASLIYVIDDNLLDLKPEGPVGTGPSTESLMMVRYLARHADGIIVSTNCLKERFARLNDRIAVVPNALDERLLEGGVFGPRPPNDRKVIGY